MPQFHVLTPLRHNGTHHEPGAVVDLPATVAAALPAGVVEPAPEVLSSGLETDLPPASSDAGTSTDSVDEVDGTEPSQGGAEPGAGAAAPAAGATKPRARAKKK
ncbi:MAG: hypothetical protein KDH20_02010 [Rhodocyclaceae bacterium]|nr:hypothetical protein [Gammaproteobacteria bacterium]MCB1886357.1 hypothetical protein [Rhodocyclaceae bacterium]